MAQVYANNLKSIICSIFLQLALLGLELMCKVKGMGQVIV
jgi:hypothetical protein